MRRSDSDEGDSVIGLIGTNGSMIDRDAIRLRWEADGSKRDERGRRLWAASEVRAAGWGGLAAVSDITGLARSTIERGLKDIDTAPLGKGRVRRERGGTRRKSDRDATLLDNLRHLVEPDTLGDPVRLWVSKSLEKLSSALADMGHSVSPNTVRMLLATKLGFSRQSDRKADEGTNHPDRSAQFEYINAQVLAARAAGAGLAPTASCRRRSTAPISPAHAGYGSRSAIPPASPCSGSAVRYGTDEPQAAHAGDDPSQERIRCVPRATA
jgi:hypothetical protein